MTRRNLLSRLAVAVALLLLQLLPLQAQAQPAGGSSVRALKARAMRLAMQPLEPTDSALEAYGRELTAALDDLAQADTTAYRATGQYLSDMLYNPASPYRDERRLPPLLRHMAASPASDLALRSQAADRLHLVLLNRPGHTVSDIEMRLADGSEATLHSMPERPTLLFIGDPACHACGEVASRLTASDAFRQAVSGGRLLVVMLSVAATEAEWRSHVADMPRDWILAWDEWGYATDGDHFDLLALPTLYLLDADHKVVVKDATVEQVLQSLPAI